MGAWATAGALVFTGLQAYSAQQQTRAGQEQAAAAREQNLTQTLGQSVEQLGSQELSVRLLGLHTLGRLLQNSPQDREAMVQGLAQFIQDQAARRPPPRPEADVPAPADLQLALDVLFIKPVFTCTSDKRDLQRVTLSHADLSNTYLFRGNLTCADLLEANLTGASLFRTNLTCASLFKANLTRASLSGANLTDADLSGANLTRADLRGVNLSTARGLTQAQVDSACTDEKTVLPAGIHGRACPPA